MPGAQQTFKKAARTLRRLVRQATGSAPRIKVNHRCQRELLGSEYGGWCICPSRTSRGTVVYSFGVGADISFETQIIDKYGAQVHAFDPTPKSIRWIEARALPAGLTFHPVGLAHFDGQARFSLPRADFISYSMDEQTGSGEPADPTLSADIVTADVQRLGTIMKRLGHESIDILKMDIEGAEYSALTDILDSDVRPNQILVEFHYQHADRDAVQRTLQTVEALHRAGYRAFHRSPLGHECSFIQVAGA
jgi:FkbM family methyltransferase